MSNCLEIFGILFNFFPIAGRKNLLVSGISSGSKKKEKKRNSELFDIN